LTGKCNFTIFRTILLSRKSTWVLVAYGNQDIIARHPDPTMVWENFRIAFSQMMPAAQVENNIRTVDLGGNPVKI
jgi:hypothetical protein